MIWQHQDRKLAKFSRCSPCEFRIRELLQNMVSGAVLLNI